MASSIEVRERQKHHLKSLLNIKKSNEGKDVSGLQFEIENAIAVMEQEDVAWVEKIVGIKAM
ncbi:MAG: hypothetical protein FWD48_12425 [Oscillospiraceae bacterium]|nr:hypothetical protein [Oscillospiraceae bacterium]